MESRPSQQPLPQEGQPIAPDVLRIASGFNFLLSEQAGRRVNGTNGRGARTTHIDIEEPSVFITNGPVTWGVKMEAGFVYERDGAIREHFANLYDRNVWFHTSLPLNPETGEVDADKVAEWDEMKRQRVLGIMDRLTQVVFSADSATPEKHEE